MRAIPAASAALLGVVALTSCVPAAGAGDITPFGFGVEPPTVAAGGKVTLWVDRAGGGCKGRATVSAPVFDTVTIPPDRSSARAVVDRDAKPGAVYQVSFACDGMSGTTSLTIAGHPGPGPAPSPSASHNPLPPPPKKGVHAGEGGSLDGFDPQGIGLGAALVVGSIGAAYHFSRRRGGEGGA
ncbi:hypothetical protein SUDANB6_00460 [Streptomyces sp. enrichment culture]|uniref:hypothetical protein n=1 Tax=Streptomyces sp. enrichment culture TaxID=1795815 RepID=UPI003F5458BD